MGLGIKITKSFHRLGDKINHTTNKLGQKIDKGMDKMQKKTSGVIHLAEHKVGGVINAADNFADKKVGQVNKTIDNYSDKAVKQSGKLTNKLVKATDIAGKIVGAANAAGLSGVPVLGTLGMAAQKSLAKAEQGARKLDSMRDKAAAKVKQGQAQLTKQVILEKDNIRKKLDRAAADASSQASSFV